MSDLNAFTGGKLGNGRRRMPGAAVSSAIWALAVTLGGCASAPSGPVSERLDPDTATTVTILSKPIELLSLGSQNSHGGINDPFAYIAPFETDRAGERDLYLWVSTPQTQGPPQQPQVLCNGQTLSLQPLSEAPKVDLSQLSLSREPYDAPVPWSTQWYFRLPADGLKCLADANGIAVEARSQDGTQAEFSASGRKRLASLDAFTHR
jgi:hypothetical protein